MYVYILWHDGHDTILGVFLSMGTLRIAANALPAYIKRNDLLYQAWYVGIAHSGEPPARPVFPEEESDV